eukprot:31055-Pelagococcus_subviridis.AAC.3
MFSSDESWLFVTGIYKHTFIRSERVLGEFSGGNPALLRAAGMTTGGVGGANISGGANLNSNAVGHTRISFDVFKLFKSSSRDVLLH